MQTTTTSHRSDRPAAPRGGDALLRLDDVVRVFGRGEGAVRALDGVTLGFARGHVHRRDGAVGLRQVDAAPGRRRARPPHRGHACSSATATSAR